LKDAELLANALYLKVLREEVPTKKAYDMIILETLGKKAAKVALDWKTNIADYIVACRQDGGIPIFKTRYAEEPLRTVSGERAVLALCWAGKGSIEGKWFVNVPEEDIERMERELGDWRFLIEEYGEPDQIRKAYEAKVIL